MNKLSNLREAIAKQVIGQEDLIENMLVCLISGGHMLIEGMPGLAKSTAASAIAQAIEGNFHRIQFTPDLLPSDLIGTELYLKEKNDFIFRQGPIFNNILMADEINRAPAKVQSALLEAMGEGQVTVGHQSYKLPELYMVIATQNPIEQEGTYNLPEAQLDRFLMNVILDYPKIDEELKIIDLDAEKQSEIYSSHLQKTKLSKNDSVKKINKPKFNSITTQEDIFKARMSASQIHVSDKLKEYIISLVSATRTPEKYDQSLAKWIDYGISPRGAIALMRSSKALAWLRSDEYVTPYHVQQIAPHIMRHRIVHSFESEAENITQNDIITKLLEVVPIP